MKMTSTKEQVLDYLNQQSEMFQSLDKQLFTTGCIASELHISRSLTSMYLNELCKEGKLVKISSRPVYYLHRDVLKKTFHIDMLPEEFLSLEELDAWIKQSDIQDQDFMKVIGHAGSLNYVISQMKSAMLYPGNGLPVMLKGKKGSGKAYLASAAYEYCRNQNVITSDALFITTYDLLEAAYDRPFIEILFGCEMHCEIKKSLLEEAAGGILYIRNASYMSKECQERLSEYIKTSMFTRVHGTRKLHSLTRIILGIEDEPYDSLCASLRLNIPVICKVPSLSQRSSMEKEELLIKFFAREEMRMKKEIMLSEALYRVLLDDLFHDSIDEMKACVQALCASSYVNGKDHSQLMIDITYLPVDMMANVKLHTASMNNEWIGLRELGNDKIKEHIFVLFQHILDAYIEYRDTYGSFEHFCTQGYNDMRKYYDFIVFDEVYDDERIRSLEKLMVSFMEPIKKSGGIELPLNCEFVLARIIYAMSKCDSAIYQWENAHHQVIEECLKELHHVMREESALAQHIAKQIHNHMDVTLCSLNMIFLMLNINFYNKDIKHPSICGIIISHGYSTASSIGDAANCLLETQVFHSIDMPLDVSTSQIQAQLLSFIKIHSYYRYFIILVDMGSLIDIAQNLSSDISIGIINNISTGLALDVGNRILQHQDLKEILSGACDNFECHYQIISPSIKEKAIVFTNDAGMKVSQRIVELFKHSLPHTIDLQFIPYEYEHLATDKLQDVLFKRYDVLLLIKPSTLNLNTIPSMTLEDIVSFKQMHQLLSIFRPYLCDDEIDVFNQRLLKNFSLQSIMENLTILNPATLLDHVSDAVSSLQNMMKRKFQSRTIIGMYIHICFLVERLVTKTPIESNDLTEFIQQHQTFIDDVHISFSRMAKHYNVVVPISEIAYLYDYIQNDMESLEEENQ